jgi:hypothetical protein
MQFFTYITEVAMPELANSRHEHFASCRAQDVPLREAYMLAGYKPDKGHPSRLAARPDIVRRIAELRSEHTDTRWADRPSVISALLEVARRALDQSTPAGAREARLAYLEASRLHEEFRASLPSPHTADPPARTKRAGATA